tara:strand:+ start:707 stop:1285 length:579 start_codon:yes stop_codon:yes gene_type:complete
MITNLTKKFSIFLFSTLLLLNSCGGKLPGGDARKNPPDPKQRVKKNLEEGRGFRLDNTIDKIRGGGGGGNFEFASSNELWRATLDIIDFMPLTSANYSGGIIITDWYSGENPDESIKVIIRFLTNEIRSDAVDIKVFYKNCKTQQSCIVSEKDGVLKNELRNEILKKATIYQKQRKDKNFKEYNASGNQKVK